MINQIARSFDKSSYEILEEDEYGLTLGRGNYCYRISLVGRYDLDVWIEGPDGDSYVVLTTPSALNGVMDELYDENWAVLGLRNDTDWV